MTENIEWRNFYMQEPIRKPDDDLYFKCACFYNAMTEIYDRGLTYKRSPYDKTEAFITGNSRIYSSQYARKIYNMVKEYISCKTNSIFNEKRWKEEGNRHYSAQGWIEVCKHLEENQDKVILELLNIYDGMEF